MSLNHSNNVNKIFQLISDHFRNPYREIDQNNYILPSNSIEVFRKSSFNQLHYHGAYSIY